MITEKKPSIEQFYENRRVRTPEYWRVRGLMSAHAEANRIAKDASIQVLGELTETLSVSAAMAHPDFVRSLNVRTAIDNHFSGEIMRVTER